MPAARQLVRHSFAARPPIFIGDEASAAGFRLAGASVRSPAPDELQDTFVRALTETDLLLLSVELARRLPSEMVRAALRGLEPMVLIVPDVAGHHAMRDLEDRLARELGVRV